MDHSTGTGSDNRDSNSPPFSDIRQRIIYELRAGGLSEVEQDRLMQEVGAVLLERATIALLNRVPPAVLVELSEDRMDPRDPAKVAEFIQRIAPHVPDMAEIITNEVKLGLEAYQAHIDKQLIV